MAGVAKQEAKRHSFSGRHCHAVNFEEQFFWQIVAQEVPRKFFYEIVAQEVP